MARSPIVILTHQFGFQLPRPLSVKNKFFPTKPQNVPTRAVPLLITIQNIRQAYPLYKTHLIRSFMPNLCILYNICSNKKPNWNGKYQDCMYKCTHGIRSVDIYIYVYIYIYIYIYIFIYINIFRRSALSAARPVIAATLGYDINHSTTSDIPWNWKSQCTRKMAASQSHTVHSKTHRVCPIHTRNMGPIGPMSSTISSPWIEPLRKGRSDMPWIIERATVQGHWQIVGR